MGRDYWHGTAKGMRGRGGRSGTSDPTVATGCMSSVFRFFHFNHFQLCYHLNRHQKHGELEHFNSHSSTPESVNGLEAPRNSSESLQAIQPLSENLTIPQMSVKTKRMVPLQTNSFLFSEELAEDGFSSPGSRTPSLVARLMGLDLLPEAASPAFSTPSTKIPLPHTQPRRKLMKNSDTQSLPDSPRISMARCSDVVDLHHRLSLHVNDTEGIGDDEGLCKRREMINSLVKNSEAEGWSTPGQYAKQIVKQVKESAGRARRVGLAEITNTAKGRETPEHRRDEHLLPARVKIKTKTTLSSLSSKKSSTMKKTTSSDVENQEPITISYTQKHLPVSQLTSSIKREITNQLNEEKTYSQKLKCRKAMEDKFKFTTCSAPAKATSKNKKTETEREPLFIRSPSPSSIANQHRYKKSLMFKKTPLSTEKFNITTTATRNSLHKIKQVAVVVFENQKGQHQLQLKKQIGSSEAKTQIVGGHEIIGQYVSKILKCMGIGNQTNINTISNGFSPSHPLNPSIFHLLEPISSSTNLIPQCNRRLIFQLTDEILADIVHPKTGSDIMRIMQMNGDQLLKLLTSKMESFPLSNCQVLQDVDALVGSDYDRVGSLDDENGSVVREIEREILDCLLFETTALL